MNQHEFLLAIREELQPLKDELRGTKDELRDFRLYVENVIEPKLQLLAENYVPAAQRYERTTPEICDLKRDMDIVKKVLMDHSRLLHQMS